MHSEKSIWLMWFGSFFSKLFYIFIWYLHPESKGNFDDNVLKVLLIIGIFSCIVGAVLNIKKFQNSPFLSKIINGSSGINNKLNFLSIKLGLVEICSVIGLIIYLNTGNSLLFFLCLGITVLGWLINIPIDKKDENIDSSL